MMFEADNIKEPEVVQQSKAQQIHSEAVPLSFAQYDHPQEAWTVAGYFPL